MFSWRNKKDSSIFLDEKCALSVAMVQDSFSTLYFILPVAFYMISDQATANMFLKPIFQS